MKPGAHANPSGMAREAYAKMLAMTEIAFERYGKKLAQRDPNAWPLERQELAAKEYRRFLVLKIIHPEESLAPTELMDAMWHEQILDTRNYGPDTIRLFGRFLHHCPEYGDGSETMAEGINRTVNLYREAFGSRPTELAGGRCSGKTCHAPSPCRCR